jgi:hypothetical protein
MLQFVDPNVLLETRRRDLLRSTTWPDLADPFDYSTHENQLILQNSLSTMEPMSTL